MSAIGAVGTTPNDQWLTQMATKIASRQGGTDSDGDNDRSGSTTGTQGTSQSLQAQTLSALEGQDPTQAASQTGATSATGQAQGAHKHHHHHHGGGGGAGETQVLNSVSSLLNTTPDALKSQLQSGQSLDQIAQANGVDQSKLIDTIKQGLLADVKA